MSVSTITSTIVADALAGDALSYASADVKIKASVRTALADLAKTAIMNSDLAGAQAALAAQDLIKGAKIVNKVEVDYAGIIARKIAVLRAAADRLEAGAANLPDGVEVSTDDIEAAEVDLDTVFDEASKIIDGLKFTSGERAAGVDLQAHLDEFLATVQPGFYTVQQIVKFQSEVAPSGLASPGAVASRLFPASGKETSFTGDFIVCERTANTPRGIEVN
jgi:hypothetical protein